MDEWGYWKKVKDITPGKRLKLGQFMSYFFLDKKLNLLFILSRYKFALKLIGNNKKVLELGCAEGFGSHMLAQNNCKVTGVDFERDGIDWAKKNLKLKNLNFKYEDFLGKTYGDFDVILSIDVIEHILPKNEKKFLDTICNNLKDTGFCLIGTPNKTSKKFASKESNLGHINLYTKEKIEKLFLKKFHNVFIFGMNDEVVHTGFHPMCHYLFVLACNKKVCSNKD